MPVVNQKEKMSEEVWARKLTFYSIIYYIKILSNIYSQLLSSEIKILHSDLYIDVIFAHSFYPFIHPCLIMTVDFI